MGTDPRAPLALHSRAPASHRKLSRWFTRCALLLLMAGALFGSTSALVAHAAPLTSSLAGQLRDFNEVDGSPTFVQHRPQVYLVFWGPKWLDSNTPGISATMLTIEKTFQALAGSNYNNILSQYTDTPAGQGDQSSQRTPSTSDWLNDKYVHNDVKLMTAASGAPYPRIIDTSTPNTKDYLGIDIGLDIGVETPIGVLQNAQIRQEADKEIAANHWSVNQDSQVIVFPQQGTTYFFGTVPSGWCGMHVFNSTAANHYAYALIQYGDQYAGCYPTGAVATSLAYTAVHEYAEMATDPVVKGSNTVVPFVGSGWHASAPSLSDPTPQEIADMCEDWGTYAYSPLNNPANGTFYLPYLWSVTDQQCESSRGTEVPSADTVFPYTGVHTVQGAILTAYYATGGPSSWIGKPTTEEFNVSGGREQAFEHGYIFWSSSTALTTVSSYVGLTIASVAIGQVGGACGQYYNCEAPGEWCSDFARWVWSMSGVNVSGLSAWAATFYDYGLRYGTLSSTPHVGDAVVYGYNPSTDFAAHVAIVTNVNVDNHTITSVGGNERGGAGIVAADGPYNWTVGGSPTGQVISGYVSPSGTFTNGNGGGGNPGVVPPPPGGTAPPSGYVAPTAHYWVDTFANAPGYGANGAVVGTLYAGTNYVFCRQWGNEKSDSSGNFNHWWLWTDLDTGGKGWVSAYYLSRWGNDIAKDNSGVDIPACWAGSSGGGGTTGVTAPPGGSPPPNGYTAPATYYWVDTFASAPGYGSGGAQVGTLYAATNYAYCKEWGNEKSDSSGNYNHWWLWTDLDTGGQGWVSAYYLTHWGNDVAKDNSGTVIPTCWPGTAPGGSYSKWTVTTFGSAPGYYGAGSNWKQVGTLYAATNYVYCKAWGPKVSDSSGNYNHWWLWTDLDTGGQGWVSAYYLSLWGNDVAKDNSGNVIPNC